MPRKPRLIKPAPAPQKAVSIDDNHFGLDDFSVDGLDLNQALREARERRNGESDDDKSRRRNTAFDGLSPELGQFSVLLPFILGAKGGKYAPKIQRGLAYLAAGQMAYSYGKKGYEWVRERYFTVHEEMPDVYTVFFDKTDDMAEVLMDYAAKQQAAKAAERGEVNSHILYGELNTEWVNSALYEAGLTKSDVKTASSDEYDGYDDGDDENMRVHKVTLQPDRALLKLKIELDGFTYDLSINRGKPGEKKPEDEEFEKAAGYGGAYSNTRFSEYLYVRCMGADALERFKQLLVELTPPPMKLPANRRRSSTLMSYDATRNDWVNKYGRVSRELDSVVLHEGQSEAVIADIENFLALEKDYVEYGATWRRGILLYGPPGGGKTSFVTALASELGLDIYYIGLQEVKTNEQLTGAIRQVRGKGIIVFEDVDVVVPTRESATASGVTLDALLSIMDGMLTPHGAVFMLTTNDVSKLDPALIRPGRIDLKLEIGYLNDTQAAKMTERFMRREVELPKIDREIMPAALSGIFKRFLHDREAALPEIVALLSGDTLEVTPNIRAKEKVR